MDYKLYEHPLFTIRHELLSPEERIRVTYERAHLVIQTWNLTGEEITSCNKRFWDLQQDPVLGADYALINVLMCTLNLFVGTLYPLLQGRPYLKPVIDKALKGELFGNLFLSEVGHGLDIQSVETTATKVTDGFILNTPSSGAVKFMPGSLPLCGFARWGVVIARLIVDGENNGIHPFLVQTSDEHGAVCPGVTSSVLPMRVGSVLDYSMTTFHSVHLPPTAFLGIGLEKPKDRRKLLQSYIWRISVGTSALGIPVVSSCKMLACVAADYSYRRNVQGRNMELVPIISFRTQALPVLYAVAIAHVFGAWAKRAADFFTENPRERWTPFGVVLKATVCRLVARTSHDLGERLGAQSLFPQNVLGTLEGDLRAISIGEGDVLVICIRLFTELLLGRHQDLPVPNYPDSLLAQRYKAYVSTASAIMSSFPDGHRDSRYNDLILPFCEPGVRALGHALAYEAAVDAGVAAPLLELFEMAAIKLDTAWYSENAGITDAVRTHEEDRAASIALPDLKKYVDALDIRKAVRSPILTDEKWEKWVADVKRESVAFAGGLLKRSERLERMLAKL